MRPGCFRSAMTGYSSLRNWTRFAADALASVVTLKPRKSGIRAWAAAQLDQVERGRIPDPRAAAPLLVQDPGGRHGRAGGCRLIEVEPGFLRACEYGMMHMVIGLAVTCTPACVLAPAGFPWTRHSRGHRKLMHTRGRGIIPTWTGITS